MRGSALHARLPTLVVSLTRNTLRLREGLSGFRMSYVCSKSVGLEIPAFWEHFACRASASF